MSISKKRIEEIEAIREEDIDFSDIPATGDAFWNRVELRMPKTKKGVYVRLDEDVLDWLKSKGAGYQTRMNAMLRALMETDRSAR
ncbi:MAG: 3-oxoacyl-ACP synthase [Acidobacteria bacterium]|nr:3-oxoacyl-ACP synthase [Acidobacteriota bacterium]